MGVGPYREMVDRDLADRLVGAHLDLPLQQRQCLIGSEGGGFGRGHRSKVSTVRRRFNAASAWRRPSKLPSVAPQDEGGLWMA